MKYLLIWLAIIISFSVYVYHYNNNWESEMETNYGEVYITKYGEKYHKNYHYDDRSHTITMYSAYKRGYDPCDVCVPRVMPDFMKMENEKPWYVRHWFIAIAIFTIASFFLSIQIEDHRTKTS